MIVKINIYEGDEVSVEYIEINRADIDNIKKAAKKYTEAFNGGYNGTSQPKRQHREHRQREP